MTADLLVVNSARVSLSKRHSSLSETDPNLIRFLYQHSHWTPFGHPQLALIWPTNTIDPIHVLLNQTPGSETCILNNSINITRGSLWYWIQNRHLYKAHQYRIENVIAQHAPITAQIIGLPAFDPKIPLCEFPITDDWVAKDLKNRLKLAWMTVLVEAPVPIRTQLFKHKVGFVENEVSRRYVDTPPEFFLPETWRTRSPGVKQGSLKTPIRATFLANLIARCTYFVSNAGYRAILAFGGCPEQARFLLSQGMMTQWYWTGSLDAFVRAIQLRDSEHAQEETWKIMQHIKTLIQTQWPMTSQKIFKP